MMANEPEEIADEIVWTPREAFACALCWSGFSFVVGERAYTPEEYWLSITPRARNEYRRVARNRLLLPVACSQAVAVLPPEAWSPDELELLGGFAKLTAKHRIRQILMAVWRAANLRSERGSGDQP